ncbi:hypothetical protein RRG08_042685 [Elysia crispata]|uniref:Uncharacterized protein n=1 Tax=Elysia crispata TaxID=231223 RepID=A0AAE1CKE9_9GAST|nr:hypothetical protein RRG08_042685 [Elysia crispata]
MFVSGLPLLPLLLCGQEDLPNPAPGHARCDRHLEKFQVYDSASPTCIRNFCNTRDCHFCKHRSHSARELSSICDMSLKILISYTKDNFFG